MVPRPRSCAGKPLLIALAFLPLAGCQYSFQVKAVREGDAYVLRAKGGDGHFSPKACVRSLAVKEAGRTIWQIENPRNGWEGDCRQDFPVVYGRAPEGFATVVPAEPLRPGVAYTINGSGVAGLYGAFSVRADLSVANEKKAKARRLSW
ncbi:MAG TPA: hypothetical protein VK403_10985 [Allosphingosinicella sp.]|nr:hypothetical protein [Allosphingosinicella sp.]